MKALVLAAGRGSRLESGIEQPNKCMLRLFGKPLVQYSLENASRAGASEIVIVVGFQAEDVINGFGIDFEGTSVLRPVRSSSSVMHSSREIVLSVPPPML